MRRLLKSFERQVRLAVHNPNKFRAITRLPVHALRHYRDIVQKETVLVDDDFDRLYGTETSQRIFAANLRIPSRNWIHASPYFPTPSRLLPEIIAEHSIQTDGLTFIDLGCGKGRMLLMASQLPFRRVLGVELSPELFRVALKNIAAYKGPRKCSEVEAACGDFTEFKFPDNPLFFFLYNPASLDLSRVLASRISASFEAHPREAWMLYVTPYDGMDFGSRFDNVASGECCGHPYVLYHATATATSSSAPTGLNRSEQTARL